MKKLSAVAGVLIILAMLSLSQVLFTVDQTESALLVQLGKPVRTIHDPGLHVKVPFVQQVIFFDNRILEYDAAAKGIITRDKKNLVVDNFAKWRIKDPLRFYQTMRNEFGAQARLDDIIYSNLRAELGKYDLIQMVSENRSQIMKTVTQDTNRKALSYGIEVVDVRIKRADLPPENEKHVYDRMKAEREQEAKRYRSEGEEAAMKIRAEAEKEKTIILAEAKRKSQELKGEGDASATKIYAEAFQNDPEFFEFIRSMDAYKKSLPDKTLLLIGPESEFFRFLKKSR
ncbi:MAG: protease modulator HflC [Nitrospirae bacterium CG_4_9_14_3_um_filter_53_35]|nr:MAG: HflC protein [Nitrospirae bacterium CG2_30_53_67]PIS36777.1 MAG: protease modulator HflC [Nitrospirae bacterium CG08_land_8_20_14_0_20_52_24]PIV85709.1 MAG: protease modulator HflC [Nitrospirae bacterium CG17_big_fil_post_rev_8_21_14_2_50_50_9]PIW84866.1 MAG: protease modulator HflC [Nitrospirae bacterium CG_4_8_14_3_um_filter_50_41]PIX85388.1 MAG: protease modulator HflC [Nitrospirae bacterium CG_4_10_14_3_um_filter_53_41]PJA77421.1 MAG: protease modulator HflC [Nitrospirae bacterium 